MAAGLSEVTQGIVGKLSLLAVQDLDGSVFRLGDLAIEQVISWGPEPRGRKSKGVQDRTHSLSVHVRLHTCRHE